MQSGEFQEFLSDHDSVRNALQRASEAAPAKGFGAVTEMATLVLLFPPESGPRASESGPRA